MDLMVQVQTILEVVREVLTKILSNDFRTRMKVTVLSRNMRKRKTLMDGTTL